MKKIIVLLLAVLLLFTACTGGSNSTAPSGEETAAATSPPAQNGTLASNASPTPYVKSVTEAELIDIKLPQQVMWESVLNYKFESTDNEKELLWSNYSTREEFLGEICKDIESRFALFQASLAGIDAIYVGVELDAYDHPTLPEGLTDLPTAYVQGIIADDQLLSQWKALLSSATLVKKEDYDINRYVKWGDNGQLSGTGGCSISYSVNYHGTLTKVLNGGPYIASKYTYASPYNIAFKSEEDKAAFAAIEKRIEEMAVKKYVDAYNSQAMKPFITD